MNLVTMRDVSVAYDGYEAIQHVDLEIGDDDFLGVIGPNGGGKTTLVKAILGTVPHTGEICDLLVKTGAETPQKQENATL